MRFLDDVEGDRSSRPMANQCCYGRFNGLYRKPLCEGMQRQYALHRRPVGDLLADATSAHKEATIVAKKSLEAATCAELAWRPERCDEVMKRVEEELADTQDFPRQPQSDFWEISGRPKFVAVAGSDLDEEVWFDADWGFLSSVLTAYANHWALRTRPDDWWQVATRRIAHEISRKGNLAAVRDFFVAYEGKKELVETIPNHNLRHWSWNSTIQGFVKQIRETIKVPEFVDATSSDFSTSEAVHQTATNIMLMKSMENYFSYRADIVCGIPAVYLLGEESDWEHLLGKLDSLQTILKPVSEAIYIAENPTPENSYYFDGHSYRKIVEPTLEEVLSEARGIFQKLLETYRGNPDREWWADIVSYVDLTG